MDETPPNVRSRRDIKEALLKKAIKEGRGPEMISQILSRITSGQDVPSDHQEILAESRYVDDGQPRGVRLLNAWARHHGESERYVHTNRVIAPPSPTLQ